MQARPWLRLLATISDADAFGVFFLGMLQDSKLTEWLSNKLLGSQIRSRQALGLDSFHYPGTGFGNDLGQSDIGSFDHVRRLSSDL